LPCSLRNLEKNVKYFTFCKDLYEALTKKKILESPKLRQTCTAFVKLLLESSYQESADVARLRIADNSFAQATPIEIDYATQIRVMQSSELLERASVLLQGEYPDISAPDVGRGLAVFRVTETEDEVENKYSAS